MLWPLGEGSTGIGALDAAAVWAGGVVAVLGFLGGLWRFLRRGRAVVRRLDQFIDDWQGTESRPGVEGRPGVMERLSRIERTVGVVVHEVRPNAGGSMRDAINRVDRRTASLAGDEEIPPAGPPD